MRVHPRAVVAEDRLRHERGALAGGARDVADDVLVGHDLVGHARERLVAEVDLALSRRGDLVVVELARDSQTLQGEDDLGAEVVQRVVRGRREVAALLAHGVAEPRHRGVPVALGRVDREVGAVRRQLVGHLVEDEELAFGAEVRRVGDPGLGQVGLRTACDTARVASVGLSGGRVGDLAEERERRHRRERVEDRASRVRQQQEVALGDPLPAADRGAVEAEPLREGRRPERADRERHVLPAPQQVAELEVDQLRLLLEGPRDRLVGLRLGSVRQVCPRVDLLHRPSFGPRKKPQRSSRPLRLHRPHGAAVGAAHSP